MTLPQSERRAQFMQFMRCTVTASKQHINCLTGLHSMTLSDCVTVCAVKAMCNKGLVFSKSSTPFLWGGGGGGEGAYLVDGEGSLQQLSGGGVNVACWALCCQASPQPSELGSHSSAIWLCSPAAITHHVLLHTQHCCCCSAYAKACGRRSMAWHCMAVHCMA